MTNGQPLLFNMNTDYATLKNDSVPTTLSVVVPGSQVITAGNSVSFSNTVTVGTPGAPMNFRMSYSYNNFQFSTNIIQYTTPGSLGDYSVVLLVYRSGPNQVTITATIFNPYGSNLTTEATTRTATAYIRTFIPPFN